MLHVHRLSFVNHNIERFHSLGQHLCKFIGTKESVCVRKEFNFHRTGLEHQDGRGFIVLGHPNGRRDVMCKHSVRNLTSVSYFWAPNGLNELPAARFEFPFILIGKSTMAFLTGQSYHVLKWGPRKKISALFRRRT